MKRLFFLLSLLSMPLIGIAQNHLLISEIVVTPTDGEFVEIFNASDTTIDLSDYYLTDATFSPGGAFYYNIVTGSNAGGGTFSDFHARFPEGASIAPGEAQVVAMNGAGFVTTYGQQPNYELWDTDANIPDMREALPRSINNQGGLTNSGEVVVLYYWDGLSDLVKDVDYVVWGDKAEAVDKTGVSIDGPDADNTPSTYLPDTPIDQQISVSSADPHAFGESIQRVSIEEAGETLSGGNGITGHNETSEDLAAAFPVGTPNPGSAPFAQNSPVIESVTQNPPSPGPQDDVSISAMVTDNEMVVRVQLFYTVNGAGPDSVAMNLVSADTYEGIIPRQPTGTVVNYYIKAEDNDGLVTSSPTFSYTVISTTPGEVHLMISEIVVTPTDGEYVEITNPTEETIDLSNYYLTDATFGPGGTFYYRIVTGSNAGGGEFGDFHARFPSGARIAPGEFQVIAMNGSGFEATYGQPPTYELWDTDGAIPDMQEALPGSINNQGSLTNSGEVVILYFWNGFSDLVKDVDYVVWGDKAEAVDKTGVSIDGPDADNTPSTYLPDTPIDQQISVSSADPHAFGESIQRIILKEFGERLFGGNGITGHDETSEDLQASFRVGTPNPGTGPSAEGLADGSGLAFTSLSNVRADSTLNFKVSVLGSVPSEIRTVEVDVPLFWSWSGEAADVLLSGGGFADAQATVVLNQGMFSLRVENAAIALGDTGSVEFQNIATPSDSIRSVFWIKTAGEGGQLKFISSSPVVSVNNGVRHLIYDLQKNSANFNGSVTVRGVTTIGAGLLRKFSSAGDSLTTAYIQDNSGRGINLFRFGVIDSLLQRGNYVEVTGPVTEFNLVTEIEYSSIRLRQKNFPLPAPFRLTNSEVNSPEWDGTLIETYGVVIDKFSAGGGTSIVLSDGNGSTTVRVWDTAELDLSDIEVNKAITARGVGGVFVSSGGDTVYQILSVYQDQLEIDPNYQPSLANAALDVEPYPFVPDRGERIRITYNASAVNNHVTIRIFDLGGRLISTLLDEDAQFISRSFFWDGRDELRDLVPLGTYICHMEVIEPVSGKKKVRTAPIVVGTVLSK